MVTKHSEFDLLHRVENQINFLSRETKKSVVEFFLLFALKCDQAAIEIMTNNI